MLTPKIVAFLFYVLSGFIVVVPTSWFIGETDYQRQMIRALVVTLTLFQACFWGIVAAWGKSI